mgnify:CR=1 FL=1
MNRADEDAAARFDIKVGETSLQFARAFVIVGDARYSPRLMDVFVQHPSHLESKGFRLPTTRPGQHNAMTGGLIRGPLTWIFT